MADIETSSPGDITRSDRTKGSGSGGTLASTVYDRLRGDILDGTLKPGEKLRAETLRERYGVGNSPIREALNRLSADGLVSREDQKGFRVASVSHENLMELVKTRCWLEETALRESIAHGTDDWEEAVVLAFHRLSRVDRASPDNPDKINPEWEERHRAYHMALISACGSSWLQQFCAQLNDQANRYRQLAAYVNYPNRNELAEHEAIKDAAISRNANEAVKLLYAHYNRIVKETIPELEDAN